MIAEEYNRSKMKQGLEIRDQKFEGQGIRLKIPQHLCPLTPSLAQIPSPSSHSPHNLPAIWDGKMKRRSVPWF